MKTATDLSQAFVFDLSPDELKARLRPSAEAVKKETFSKGGYLTYYDPLVCPTTSHAVHEYADRKELMWMDDHYQDHFVKTL